MYRWQVKLCDPIVIHESYLSALEIRRSYIKCYAVEQSARTASATGHHLRTIQTIVENVYVLLVGPRRLVSER